MDMSQPGARWVMGIGMAYVAIRVLVNTYRERHPDRYPDHRHWFV